MSAASDYRRFEIPGVAKFAATPDGLPRLCIQTAQAQAELFLHGAHVTHFQPTGAEPVIWPVWVDVCRSDGSHRPVSSRGALILSFSGFLLTTGFGACYIHFDISRNVVIP